MRRPGKHWWLHLFLLMVAVPTLMPFVFVLNNSFRTSSEMLHGYFGVPRAARAALSCAWRALRGSPGPSFVITDAKQTLALSHTHALRYHLRLLLRNYRDAWTSVRPYLRNTLWVVCAVATGVLILGTATAFVLSRFPFPGRTVVFYYFLSTMMFPGVLTLVPSFLLIKRLGLLNSYSALIVPMVAGGQVFAIFVFKSFFDGLSQDLFDAAKIDGAGLFSLYWHLLLPLSRPVIAVVLIINILGTWNNFLWPFIVNTDPRYHIVASGLYVMSASESASNPGMLFAAYVITSIPLLLLFACATRAFMQGMTSGAFKA
ncbi:MAG: carbohydrate ABC transporter permease [bacterium]|nr:carbohydrate ABC transporter permease [bacterium]